MGRVTIKEVASIAGVSPASVSLAVNGKPGISQETREKILKVVEQVGFVTNETSRRLRSNRTGNIAVLMESGPSLLEQAFYSELNNQILHECEQFRYNVIYCIATIEDDTKVVLPNVIQSRDVDGIIIVGYLDLRIVYKISAIDCPIILVDNYLDVPGICNVVFDYRKAAVVAMEYLIDSGHRKIAYIGSDIDGNFKNFGQQTFYGYKSILEKYSLLVPGSWIQMSAHDENTASEAMNIIISSDSLPSAVLCSGDIFAIGAMKSVKGSGLMVPDDISVMGIDDILLSSYVEPALTTVRVDRHNMALTAVKILLEAIESKKPVMDRAICDVFSLIERASVKKITR